jgi:GTP-binding protein
LRPLFDAVVKTIPPPRGSVSAPLQARRQSRLERLPGPAAIGRIFNGRVKVGDPIAVCKL